MVVIAHTVLFLLRVGTMKLFPLTIAAVLQECVGARILGQRDASTDNSSFNVLDYVDPLIGTANGGLSSQNTSVSWTCDANLDICIQAMYLLARHCLLVSSIVHPS